MQGYIHIYCGDGKGKTTAATGLAIRTLGNKGTVLMARFLKNENSCELEILRTLEGMEIIENHKNFGFSWLMSADEKLEAKEYYNGILKTAIKKVQEQDYKMLILDEVLAAYNLDFIDKESLLGFLSHKPTELEIILTGRNPDSRLVKLSDYISKIQKIKHPYDSGIAARKGIEY